MIFLSIAITDWRRMLHYKEAPCVPSSSRILHNDRANLEGNTTVIYHWSIIDQRSLILEELCYPRSLPL